MPKTKKMFGTQLVLQIDPVVKAEGQALANVLYEGNLSALTRAALTDFINKHKQKKGKQ